MTMASFEASSEQERDFFKAAQDTKRIFQEKQIPNMPMTELSGNVSRDYKGDSIRFYTFSYIGTIF